MPSTLLSSLHAIRLRSNLDYPHSLVRSLRMLQDGVHAVVNRRRVVPLLRQIPYIVLKLRELLDLGGRLSSLHPVLCSTLTTIVNTLHIPCDTLRLAPPSIRLHWLLLLVDRLLHMERLQRLLDTLQNRVHHATPYPLPLVLKPRDRKSVV